MHDIAYTAHLRTFPRTRTRVRELTKDPPLLCGSVVVREAKQDPVIPVLLAPPLSLCRPPLRGGCTCAPSLLLLADLSGTPYSKHRSYPGVYARVSYRALLISARVCEKITRVKKLYEDAPLYFVELNTGEARSYDPFPLAPPLSLCVAPLSVPWIRLCALATAAGCPCVSCTRQKTGTTPDDNKKE